MNTISKVVEKLVVSSPFLEEALTEKLINVSSLARKIKHQVEDEMGMEIKEGAIVMAINRLSPNYYYKVNIGIKDFVNQIGDIIVRSNLSSYTFVNSNSLTHQHVKLLQEITEQKNIFYSFSQGVYETTIVVSEALNTKLEELFTAEKMISNKRTLSSITVKLPMENTEVSGLYYFIFKKLAWVGINIVEVISTTNEFTVIVKEDDVDTAFSILKNLKKS
ncbi:MAG: aspartate kinase [Flavobacteriales bacterium]